MSSKNSYVVNFHGIGTPVRTLESNESEYWISEEQFKQFIALIKHLKNSQPLKVTFDDGNVSDYEIALPVLTEAHISGLFCILAGKINSEGYLSPEQICALSNSGHEIGLHGMDHLDWTGLDNNALIRETEQARSVLEEITSKPVDTVAVPFGCYNRVVINRLKKLGFKRIYTSDRGKRFKQSMVRPRFSVTQHTELLNLENQIVKSNSILNRIVCEVKYQFKSWR